MYSYGTDPFRTQIFYDNPVIYPPELALEAKQAHGYTCREKWCLEYWGTPSNAMKSVFEVIAPERIRLEFETLYLPPLKILNALTTEVPCHIKGWFFPCSGYAAVVRGRKADIFVLPDIYDLQQLKVLEAKNAERRQAYEEAMGERWEVERRSDSREAVTR